MDLFDLFARIFLDSSEYEKGLGESEKKTESFGSKIKKGLTTSLKVGAAAITAVTTSALAMGGAMLKATGDVAAHGDEIDKMSQKLGLSYSAYQEWDYILGQAGVDITSMSTGLKTLTNKLDDAKNGGTDAQEMFAKLGLSMEDLASMSREEVFEAAIRGFQGMADSTERAALANDLFGKSGQELTPLFNSTIEETQALKEAAHDLGFVMSDESVKSAADYQDALDTLKRSFGGVKQRMMGDFMPSITKVMEGLSSIFAGDKSGIAKLSEGIKDFVSNLSKAMPDIMQAGGEIVLTLVDAIIENLPLLISSASDTILMLATGLIEELPTIISAGLEVLLALAQGIAESLPELIPTIVDVVLQIVDTLTQPDTLSSLIDAAIAILIALADGLIESLPELIERIPEIVSNLVDALIENAPKLLDAAWELITSLAQGLIDNLPEIYQKGKDIVNKLLDGIGELLSKLGDKAKELIGKFTDGIKEKFEAIKDKGREIVNKVKDGFMEKVEAAKNWGKDLINNFIGGITEKWEALKTKVSNIAQSVKDFLGFSEPKLGPLSDFHTYAPDMMELFAKGIEDNAPVVTGAIEKSFDFGDLLGFGDDSEYIVTTDDFSTGSGYRRNAEAGLLEEVIGLLQDIRDNMGHDIVLSDGTLAGRMDKLLGRRAVQRARGNA